MAAAFRQSWPPFVLVLGLLLIGVVAAADGLFAAVGTRLSRIGRRGVTLFAVLMALVALVTVVLTLDSAVIFVTPIVLHAARRRRLQEDAFLYGTVFMSNAASLLLPGSNLTNLLVMGTHGGGHGFASTMAAPWLASVLATLAVVAVWRRHDLQPEAPRPGGTEPIRGVVGAAGIVAAATLTLVFANPALPVLAVGVVACVLARPPWATLRTAVNAGALLGLFALCLVMGALSPVTLRLGAVGSAAVGASASVLVNNLPAAVILSVHRPSHPVALLFGLDLGPNLAVWGALSGILWLRVSRAEGARPSVWTYSRVGIVAAPLAIAAALVAQKM